MKVLVAGASGAIGRRLVPMLVEVGHEVVGTTSTSAHVDAVAELGAEAVVCDVLDANAVHEAVTKARPEVVIHQVTRVPDSIDPRRYAQQFAQNNRLRREGTRNLVAAALAAGARRVIGQSVAFAYRTDGTRLKTERDPLNVEAPDPFGDTIRALDELERTVLEADGIEGVVLRYGYFYGPGTAFAPDGPTAERVRRHRFPVVGKGRGVFSFIHVDDAARATVLAIDHGGPGIYNIVDDEPAEMADWLPEYARALGARAPGKAPAWVARLAAGKRAVALLSAGRGASNAKAKAELDWWPAYPSWREGFAETLQAS